MASFDEPSNPVMPIKAPAFTPMEWLAHSAVHVMRYMRIGPFGCQQRHWQEAMKATCGQGLATNLELGRAFSAHDNAAKRKAGQAMHCWITKVIEPALETVADVFADLHAINDHPISVQHALFCCGLLPEQAAGRIRESRRSVATAFSKLLATETLQSLRCPPAWREHSWTNQSTGYVLWQMDRQMGSPQQPVVYPVTSTHWYIEIRRWALPLRVVLNAQRFEVDLRQRLWEMNRVRVVGTILWHHKMPAISTMLLRNIAHTDPSEYGLVELARYLTDEGFESISGPIVVIDAIEKTSDVADVEVAHAVQSFVDSLLKIHLPGAKAGTIAWNGLPAPWLYPPNKEELLPHDWEQYDHACQGIARALSRIDFCLKQAHGVALTTVNLFWERKR